MATYENDLRYTSNIANGYVKRPKDLSGYTAYRGVTDFTNIGQFNQFETGYSFLFVIQMPKFMKALADADTANIGLIYIFKCNLKLIILQDNFQRVLKYNSINILLELFTFTRNFCSNLVL